MDNREEMMTSSTPEPYLPQQANDPGFEITGYLQDLPTDPDYLRMVELYEHAEFSQCQEVLLDLEQRYPEYPELMKFKEDLQLKLSLKNIAVKEKQQQKNTKRKSTLNLGIFAIVGTVIVLVVFFISFLNLQMNERSTELQMKTAQLSTLYNQADQLLIAGKPQPVVEIIALINLVDPQYTELDGLTSRTAKLLQLERKYQAAMGLITENKSLEALVLLQEIEEIYPGMWDVRQQISTIQRSTDVETYIAEGRAAFQKNDWLKVINAYENAMILDPKLDDPEMKEQLLRSYLNVIISLLQDETATIEEMENAELYYRRALAMVPQNKDFASERGDLQEVSSNMLVVKYAQTARTLLEDKSQNANSIAKAVSYLNSAVNIVPNNNTFQTELNNAQLYQLAFKNFVDLDWGSAITNLNQLISVDSNYANGNARILLYEAYFTLGKQQLLAGNYQDARSKFEQAEKLARQDSNNLLKLFQVQVLLGDTLGKMEDYQNAVSYYKLALDSIQFLPRLTDYPAVAIKFYQANDQAVNGNFFDAFSTYQEGLAEVDVIYTVVQKGIKDGACLAFFAHENNSTLNAVLEANDLPNNMVITYGRNLSIPTLEK
jgi:tetratricopeptide (TPR) repeat protein